MDKPYPRKPQKSESMAKLAPHVLCAVIDGATRVCWPLAGAKGCWYQAGKKRWRRREILLPTSLYKHVSGDSRLVAPSPSRLAFLGRLVAVGWDNEKLSHTKHAWQKRILPCISMRQSLLDLGKERVRRSDGECSSVHAAGRHRGGTAEGIRVVQERPTVSPAQRYYLVTSNSRGHERL